MKKTFIFYSDWIDYTEEMNNQEKWIFLQTILNYQNWKELWNIDCIKFIWTRIKKQLDKDNEKWLDILNKRKLAGSNWWKQKVANASKCKQDVAVNVNVNVNDNDINIIDKSIIEQSSEIIKIDKRIIEIDIILEMIKEKHWIIDWTVKEQRQYWKLLKDKIEKLNWFNWDYWGFIETLIDNSDKYTRWLTTSPKSIYYNLAKIITNIRMKKSEEKQFINYT